MNIQGLDKAKVLQALFNASKQLGMGFLKPHSSDMDIKEAEELLKEDTYFDYIRGRVMKINLSGDDLDTRLYNRDNGDGFAEWVINRLIKNDPST